LIDLARSLLLVNYRSAALTAAAVRSARHASSELLQVVVVDNTVDPEELALLRTIDCDVVLSAPHNLGYAGGINFGIPACRHDTIIISNPDVVFSTGSIDLLVDQVRQGAAMSGPAFFWDNHQRWLLPPADVPSLTEKADQILSTRFGFWREQRGKRRIRRRLRFWRLSQPTVVPAVSGAVMCTTREWVRTAGGFDERYMLYFEEIDFMTRLRLKGGRIVYEPRAHCRHLYNQSAGLTDDARERFLQSENLYYEKWVGSTAVGLMNSLGGSPTEPVSGFEELSDLLLPAPEGSSFVVEASPLPSFDSAAGFFPKEEEVRFPSSIWEVYRGQRLFLRVVRTADSQVLGRYVISREVSA